jgi:hypothetical protein
MAKKDYSGEIITGAVVVGLGTVLYALFGGRKDAPPAPAPPKTCGPNEVLIGGKCLPKVIVGVPPIQVVPPLGVPPVVVVPPEGTPPLETVPPLVLPPDDGPPNPPDGQPPIVLPDTPITPVCKPGEVLQNGKCVPVQQQPPGDQPCPPGQVKDMNGMCVPAFNQAVIQQGDHVLFVYHADSVVPGDAFLAALPVGITASTVRQEEGETREQLIARAEDREFDIVVDMAALAHRNVWKQGGVERASVDVYRTQADLLAHAPYYATQRLMKFDQQGYFFPPGLLEVDAITKMVEQLTDPDGPPLGTVV